MKNLLITILVVFFTINSFAFPNSNLFMNNAAYVAKIESFTNTGFLNCEFQCFLDLKYTDFDKQPLVYFQVGTKENPIAYGNKMLSNEYLQSIETEKVYSKDGYKMKLNFGKISVKNGFVARLVIFINGEEQIIKLKGTNFNNSLTIMNPEADAKEKGLCKAEQFLRKINFDRLYKDYAYVLD